MGTWFSQLASAQQSVIDSQNSLLNSQYTPDLSGLAWSGTGISAGAITQGNLGGWSSFETTTAFPAPSMVHPSNFYDQFPGIEAAKEKQRKYAVSTCAHPNVMPEEEAWLRRRVKEIEWRK